MLLLRIIRILGGPVDDLFASILEQEHQIRTLRDRHRVAILQNMPSDMAGIRGRENQDVRSGALHGERTKQCSAKCCRFQCGYHVIMSRVIKALVSRHRQITGTFAVFVAALLLSSIPPMRAADQFFNDLIRSTVSPIVPVREDIAIVAITEETVATLAYRSPINRALLARTLSDLERHQPALIGIDILLDQPTETEPDEALIRTLSSLQTRWVAASTRPPSERTKFEQHLLSGGTVASPYLAADGFDGVIRRVTSEHNELPGFAAEIAAQAGFQGAALNQPFRVFRSARQQLPFRIIPAHILPEVPVESDWLRNRIVLVGAILDEEDRHPTSLRFAQQDSRLPGVVVHAYQLAHLLDGTPRTQAPWGAVALYLILALVAGAYLGANVRQVWLWAVFAIGLLALPVLIAVLVYVAAGWSVPVLPPVLAAGLAALVAARQARAQLAGRLTYVTEAFGRYMDPDIVDRLVADPDQTFAQAKTGEAVFLFTDINDFTGFVRCHAPATVKATMDQYIELVAATIQRHSGTVDRFVGDGVHAFFGMPIPIERARETALKCAIELVDQTAEFQSQMIDDGVAFRATRIALHAGTALFGDFGGTRHADFTAHGEAVHLTARLLEYARNQQFVLCATGQAIWPEADMAGWQMDENAQLRSSDDRHVIYSLRPQDIPQVSARLFGTGSSL